MNHQILLLEQSEELVKEITFDNYGNRTGSFRTFPGGRGVMTDNVGNYRGSFRTIY